MILWIFKTIFEKKLFLFKLKFDTCLEWQLDVFHRYQPEGYVIKTKNEPI